MVYAPVSGRADTPNCALVALNGTPGVDRWSYSVPPANCTIHSVADPTLADLDSDGTKEVIAATTEQTVTAYHPLTGDVEYRVSSDNRSPSDECPEDEGTECKRDQQIFSRSPPTIRSCSETKRPWR